MWMYIVFGPFERISYLLGRIYHRVKCIFLWRCIYLFLSWNCAGIYVQKMFNRENALQFVLLPYVVMSEHQGRCMFINLLLKSWAGYVMMMSIIESCLSMIILFVQKLLYSGVRPKEAISRLSHVLFPFASECLQVLFVLNVMAMLLLVACVV